MFHSEGVWEGTIFTEGLNVTSVPLRITVGHIDAVERIVSATDTSKTDLNGHVLVPRVRGWKEDWVGWDWISAQWKPRQG